MLNPIKSLNSLSPYTLSLLGPSPPNLPTIPTLGELQRRAEDMQIPSRSALDRAIHPAASSNQDETPSPVTTLVGRSHARGAAPPGVVLPAYSSPVPIKPLTKPTDQDCKYAFSSQQPDLALGDGQGVYSAQQLDSLNQPGWFTQTPPPRYTPTRPGAKNLQPRRPGWSSLIFRSTPSTETGAGASGQALGEEGRLPDEQFVARNGSTTFDTHAGLGQ